MWWNEYKLLNPSKLDIVSENTSLCSLQYYLIQKDLRVLESLVGYIKACKTPMRGLYNQLPFPDPKVAQDAYMSPDQLIAFVGVMKVLGKIDDIRAIWGYLKQHCMTYDNLKAEINFERTMQPAAIFFVAVCAGKKWAYPGLVAAILHSCTTKKGKSSGKLKAWTMMQVLKMNTLSRICAKILSGFDGWDKVFLEYYQEDGHPIRNFWERG